MANLDAIKSALRHDSAQELVNISRGIKPAPINKSVQEQSFGFPVRQPTDDELAFFRRRTDVAGYAAEDNSIVVNPFSELMRDPDKRKGLLNIEGSRLYMRSKNFKASDLPDLTPKQREFLMSLPSPSGNGRGYSANEVDLRSTAISRYVGGDKSFPAWSDEQIRFAKSLME